jgi:hypothetical protein
MKFIFLQHSGTIENNMVACFVQVVILLNLLGIMIDNDIAHDRET